MIVTENVIFSALALITGRPLLLGHYYRTWYVLKVNKSIRDGQWLDATALRSFIVMMWTHVDTKG